MNEGKYKYEGFLHEAKELNKMDESFGIKERDDLLESYLKMATTNSCIFPGMVSQEYQDACDDSNHSRMGVLLGKITKLTHEFEGIEGVVDVIEKIRRTHSEMMTKMIIKNENDKKERENN